MRHLILIFLLFFSGLAKSQTWETLYDQAFDYYKKGAIDKAVITIEKAIAVAQKNFGEKDTNYVLSLYTEAFFYRNSGQVSKAIPVYLKGIEIRKKIIGESNPQIANDLDDLGFLYQDIAQYYKAEQIYLQASAIRKKALGENSIGYSVSLNNLGLLYRLTGEYDKAETTYLEAMAIQKKLEGENTLDFATSLSNLGSVYTVKGDYEKARSFLEKALAIRKDIAGETHPDYINSLNNVAVLYNKMGDYEKAEPVYLETLKLSKQILGEEDPRYAQTMNNLGNMYEEMGLVEKAQDLFFQVLDLRKKILGTDHPDYANSVSTVAHFLQTRGKYAGARQLYLQALDIYEKALGENSAEYCIELCNLSSLYAEMENYEEAESGYLKALEIAKKVLGEDHPDYAAIMTRLAEMNEKLERYDAAELLYKQVVAIRKKTLGEKHPVYVTGMFNLAGLYVNQHDLEKAEPLLLTALTINRTNIKNSFAVLSEEEKGSFLETDLETVAKLNSIILDNNNITPSFLRAAFNEELFLKSLVLTNTKGILEMVRKSNDSLIQKLFKDWMTNKVFLAKQYSLTVSSRSPDLSKKEKETESLEKDLNRHFSTFRQEQMAMDISMEDMQRKLQNDEAIIEFSRFTVFNKEWTDSILYAAYILRKNDSVPVFVPLFEERQLQQLFDSAGHSINSVVNSLYRGLKKGNKGTTVLGKDLYQLVWQPLEPYLNGIKKISYSPAGKLYSIAFQAIPVDSTTVLMDKYQLQQYTSVGQVALRSGENQITKPESITLFGNASFTMDSLQLVKQKDGQPGKENISSSIYGLQKRGGENGTWMDLPGTAEEVNKIRLLFEENTITAKQYTQTTASEENLKALSGHSAQVLHIATHGFFLPEPDKKKRETRLGQDNPYMLAENPLLRSGLILAGGNYAWSGKKPIDGVEDGIATAYEISQLNFSTTELVVLSACETALGEVKGSEGVFGLQRAFKLAGAKKLIVSLWQVPDRETAELMTTFYTYWIKGKNIEASFSQAQLDMRKKYAPFYWAAFVLVE